VNSGKFTGGKNLEDTIVKTNVEAAGEIARQVRLRDIGGIIVCDFIDMNTEASRNKVIQTLEAGLRRDRTRATIQSFSNLGLLEFTRKRVGKDLSSQLRGACPTCTGLGTVMSSQSVAIDALRKVRSHDHGNHQAILLETAPTVAAQLEFWYEDETKELSEHLHAPIHVRVDPMLHPEKVRLRAVSEVKPDGKLRVGDEHEVELLPGRLPNSASAAAVIEGRIIEVENAASMAGQTARIKLIDVEEDFALAELAAAAPGEKKKKRRRGGRGRKGELSATEQAQELRQLAEEAAKFSQARPPIGITTITEEEEQADRAVAAEVRAEKTPEAIVIGEAETPEREGHHRRRRRRRGRGRGGRTDEVLQAGIPVHSAQAQAEQAQVLEEEAEAEHPAHVEGEGGHRRRRRRRRRGRGRGGMLTGENGAAPQQSAVPDRHIFRVGADGSAEPTGETAPREPVRAIAPWNRRPQPPAVEPPPPHLRAPEEGAKPTKPARRRRGASEEPARRGGELEVSRTAALPAPEEPAKPKRTRKVAAAGDAPAKPKGARKKAASEGVAVAADSKPKRTRKAVDAAESAGEKAVKKTRATRKTSATKTTTRKKKS
jgi:hypothetical protein